MRKLISSRISRRGFCAGAGALAALGPRGLAAQEPPFFRIWTGSTGGTYFPIGGIIASLITDPPGLVAVAQSSQGSVANVNAVQSGRVQSALAQADVAFWGFTGSGVFSGEKPMDKLRAIANLYTEALHFVVRRDARITKVSDLRGKRISLDREGSGTRVDALLVLEAFGLGPGDFEEVAISPGQAVEAMRKGGLDGFFLISGAPTRSIADLATEVQIALVPVSGEEIDRLREEHGFLVSTSIPAVYRNVPGVSTIGVGAQWLVSSEVPADLVYKATAELWSPDGQEYLQRGHVKGREISFETALRGVVLPLHDGARRYYEERGVTHIDVETGS